MSDYETEDDIGPVITIGEITISLVQPLDGSPQCVGVSSSMGGTDEGVPLVTALGMIEMAKDTLLHADWPEEEDE